MFQRQCEISTTVILNHSAGRFFFDSLHPLRSLTYIWSRKDGFMLVGECVKERVMVSVWFLDRVDYFEVVN